MNRYEIVLVAVSDLSKDEMDGLIERYSAIIAGQKGLVVQVEKWGTRKLAYRIKKQPRGQYILIDFVGDSAVVNELERNLKFDDDILRFLTIKKEDSVDLQEIEREMENAKKAKEEKAAETKPETAPVKEEAAPAVEAAAAQETGREG